MCTRQCITTNDSSNESCFEVRSDADLKLLVLVSDLVCHVSHLDPFFQLELVRVRSQMNYNGLQY